MPSIEVTINGEPRTFDREWTIRELIEHLGMNAEVVAVERNRSIVKRGTFDEATISDGDRIEIVEFVGGG